MKNNLIVLGLVCFLFGLNFVSADDLPALPKGMWKTIRTIESSVTGERQKVPNEICISPSVVWQKQMIVSTHSGYKFSPIKKEGNTYNYTYEWTVKNDNSTELRKGTVTITVDAQDAYTSKLEIEINGKKAYTETESGKRTGDCPETK